MHHNICGSHFVPLEQQHQTQHQLHKTAEIITKLMASEAHAIMCVKLPVYVYTCIQCVSTHLIFEPKLSSEGTVADIIQTIQSKCDIIVVSDHKTDLYFLACSMIQSLKFSLNCLSIAQNFCLHCTRGSLCMVYIFNIVGSLQMYAVIFSVIQSKHNGHAFNKTVPFHINSQINIIGAPT